MHAGIFFQDLIKWHFSIARSPHQIFRVLMRHASRWGPWRMCRRHPTCRQPPRRCIVVLAAWRAWRLEQFLGRLKDGSSRHFCVRHAGYQSFKWPPSNAQRWTQRHLNATSASAIIANAKQHTREHSAVFLISFEVVGRDKNRNGGNNNETQWNLSTTRCARY